MIFISQNYFSQNQQESNIIIENNDELKFSADKIEKNDTRKTIIFNGNASLNSKSISFEKAEKMVYNTLTKKIEIYNPKNYKIHNINAFVKKSKSKNENVLIYDVKENSLNL